MVGLYIKLRVLGPCRSGDTIVAHVKAQFEDEAVFLDTRLTGTPLVWSLGIQSPVITGADLC